MNSPETAETRSGASALPSIDELLRTETGQRLTAALGRTHLTVLARDAVAAIRAELVADSCKHESRSAADLLQDAASRMEDAWAAEQRTSLRRVINATGVVIHTNLGRAPLSENARKSVIEEAAGYCTLEYDLATGKRGRRGLRAESLIAELTGAEAAVVVNNCAAAAFLVLKVFAAGGEVVVSRGELVEIGGDFRVPEVLAQSGAVLREVGTTNRTKISDYVRAISDDTRMILRVHPSNYRIIGFTSSPAVDELAALARERGIVFFEDLGSGSLGYRGGTAFADEPSVSQSVRDGVDMAAFSGDKLLGGPQAGIIAGKAECIERLRADPLYRVLRSDKLAYAALEATLDSYRRETERTEIPVVRMLALGADKIAERARRISGTLSDSGLRVETVDGFSAVGGGAGPTANLATKLLALCHDRLSADQIELRLRSSNPPVIARIVDGLVMLDLRTVDESEETELVKVLFRVMS